MGQEQTTEFYNSITLMFYDVDRLANELNVQPRTIWQYKNNGKIPKPFTSFGSSPVWTADQVKEILSKRQNSS